MSDGYSKSLKSRKWKTKRKRIIFRDGNKCTNCGSNENLCVHHIYYYKEKVQPWDYPDDALITLCEDCHSILHSKFIPDYGKEKNHDTFVFFMYGINATDATICLSYLWRLIKESRGDGVSKLITVLKTMVSNEEWK